VGTNERKLNERQMELRSFELCKLEVQYFVRNAVNIVKVKSDENTARKT
jgi:hypothetical protein